jgi:hypothetical protein
MGINESQVHESVCKYLKIAYPKVVFNTDMAGIRLSKGQAIKAKKLRSFNGFPDLVIYEQAHGFHALFIELKRPNTKIYLRNGEMTRDAHIQQQASVHNALASRGYFATFAVGFDEAKKIIDWYLQ